jgi:glucosylceramidase
MSLPEPLRTANTLFAPANLAVWLTRADQSLLLQKQGKTSGPVTGSGTDWPVIHVDTERKYQRMEGFGFALTGGSAMLIGRLPAAERDALLRELFLPSGDGIGISFLRLSIGASDLSERSFSYDDRPDGASDFELAHFDIEAGDREVIAVLQEILAINPALRLIATPWSAPPWMKTNRRFIGGKLRKDCYRVYAAYLVRYLLEMRQRGIIIQAMTPQNEPLNDRHEPSMVMEADEQAEFIKNHLGPALREADLAEIELLCWDHNCDVPAYPLAVFADPEARRYLSGSAWHLYAGDISVLSEMHRAYPGMKLYFTEQWVGADGQFGADLFWHARNVLIGSLNHWSQAVLEWNLASDPFFRPHTPGGAPNCVGALTIGERITRNAAYYVIAHAAKFIRPGAFRIHSETAADLPHAAFLTPAGRIVLIVLNERAEPQSFGIRCHGKEVSATLPAHTVATCVWRLD